MRSRMFRGLFLRYLEKAFAAGELNFFSEHRHLHEPAAFRRYLTPAWKAGWVVYAKRPFAGRNRCGDPTYEFRARAEMMCAVPG